MSDFISQRAGRSLFVGTCFEALDMGISETRLSWSCWCAKKAARENIILPAHLKPTTTTPTGTAPTAQDTSLD
jgi:hypothetical protein